MKKNNQKQKNTKKTIINVKITRGALKELQKIREINALAALEKKIDRILNGTDKHKGNYDF